VSGSGEWEESDGAEFPGYMRGGEFIHGQTAGTNCLQMAIQTTSNNFGRLMAQGCSGNNGYICQIPA